jgi:hypothetical protein
MCVQTTIELKGRLLQAERIYSLRHKKPGINSKQAGFSAVFAQTLCMFPLEYPQLHRLLRAYQGVLKTVRIFDPQRIFSTGELRIGSI